MKFVLSLIFICWVNILVAQNKDTLIYQPRIFWEFQSQKLPDWNKNNLNTIFNKINKDSIHIVLYQHIDSTASEDLSPKRLQSLLHFLNERKKQVFTGEVIRKFEISELLYFIKDEDERHLVNKKYKIYYPIVFIRYKK